MLSDMKAPCPGHEDPITHFTREAPLSAELVLRTVLSTWHRSVNKPHNSIHSPRALDLMIGSSQMDKGT